MDEPSTSSDGGAPGHRRDLDRRAVLRRGAVLGGALAWSTPVVQSLASPAFAAGSPMCETRVEDEDCTRVYDDTPDCCACVESHPDLPLAEALALCAAQGRCVRTDVEVCGEEEEKPPPKSPPPDEEGRRPRVAGEQSSVPTVAGEQSSVPTVIPAGS